MYIRYFIKLFFDVPLYTWFTVFNICGLSYTSIVVNSNWSRRICQRSQTWFWNRMKANNTTLAEQFQNVIQES